MMKRAFLSNASETWTRKMFKPKSMRRIVGRRTMKQKTLKDRSCAKSWRMTGRVSTKKQKIRNEETKTITLIGPKNKKKDRNWKKIWAFVNFGLRVCSISS